MDKNKIVQVVLDTNIIVKFMISKRSITAAKKIMTAIDEAKFISIVSNELLAEIYNTLKYMIPENIAENAIFDLEFKSTKVEIENSFSTEQEFVRDLSDSKVMQTAIEGDANFLVTNNIHNFQNISLQNQVKKEKQSDQENP